MLIWSRDYGLFLGLHMNLCFLNSGSASKLTSSITKAYEIFDLKTSEDMHLFWSLVLNFCLHTFYSHASVLYISQVSKNLNWVIFNMLYA